LVRGQAADGTPYLPEFPEFIDQAEAFKDKDPKKEVKSRPADGTSSAAKG